MKIYVLLIVIFSNLGNFTFAQDSLETALRFYPLQIGNYWEYVNYVWGGGPDTLVYYNSTEIIGDTVLENGQSYKIIKHSKLNSKTYNLRFERVDSLTANVYRFDTNPDLPNSERLIDSLLSHVSDTCKALRDPLYSIQYGYTVCLDIYDTLLFSYTTRVKKFMCDAWTLAILYKLAKNIGYLGYSRPDFGYLETKQLIYARVGGIEIGTSYTFLSDEHTNKLPSEFKLFNSYPNPFNSTTTILYFSPFQQNINIGIYDIKGSRIDKLYSGYCDSGVNKINFNAKNLSSGLYFVKVSTKNQIFWGKLIYVK